MLNAMTQCIGAKCFIPVACKPIGAINLALLMFLFLLHSYLCVSVKKAAFLSLALDASHNEIPVRSNAISFNARNSAKHSNMIKSEEIDSIGAAVASNWYEHLKQTKNTRKSTSAEDDLKSDLRTLEVFPPSKLFHEGHVILSKKVGRDADFDAMKVSMQERIKRNNGFQLNKNPPIFQQPIYSVNDKGVEMATIPLEMVTI